MEPTSDQLRVLAGALTQLRAASEPSSRVQAVRTATRAVQGLTGQDRQLLVERLLAHGAPVAASTVARHLEDLEVPPAAQTAIAQDLLGLAPAEVARVAEELLDASSPQPAPAPSPPDPARPPPTTTGRPDRAPSAVRSPVAEDPAGPPAPPVPRSSPRPRPRTRVLARATPATPEASAARPAARAPADRWMRLAAEVAAAGDVRARRDVLAGVSGPVPADRLAALLASVPDGWQRRMALRHLLTGPGIAGTIPPPALAVFDRDGDRFAAAALLLRAGLLPPDGLDAVLPAAQVARLRRRAGLRASSTLLR
ncbi:MAG: hypothetical protein ACNA8R_01420 [Nitriliruptoraceae bacterium]